MSETRTLESIIADANQIAAGYAQTSQNLSALTQAINNPIAPSLPPPPPIVPVAPPLSYFAPPPPPLMPAQPPMLPYQVDPVQAQFLAGQPTGDMNYVPPAYNTDAVFGAFRAPIVSAGQPAVHPGLGVTTAILPTTGFGAFHRAGIRSPFMRPMQAELNYYSDIANLNMMGRQQALDMVGGGMAAGAMTALGTAGGVVVGGTLGAMVGHPELGLALGSIGGSVLGSTLGQNDRMREAFGNVFRPAIEQTVDTAQIMGASQGFVSTGRDLDISGRGLSVSASGKLMRDFTDIAEASRGRFTRQDLIQVMQASGEQGLLDVAQNKEEIARTVKATTELLGMVAQITGDPDFKNNVKFIGELRRQGASETDYRNILHEIQAGATSSGMQPAEVLATAGNQGAAIYQGVGMSRVQGTRAGVFGAAASSQAIATGTFSPSQIDRLGGRSGMTQRFIEMTGQFAGKTIDPFLPYLATSNADGSISVDEDALLKFQSGEIGTDDMIRQGSSKFSNAKDLEKLVNSMGDLKEEIANRMGPQGGLIALVNTIDRTSKELGISFESAGRTIMGSAENARLLAAAIQGGALQGLRTGLETERQNVHFEARKSAMDARRDQYGVMNGISRGLGRAWDAVTDPFTNAYSSLQQTAVDANRSALMASREAALGNEYVSRNTWFFDSPAGLLADAEQQDFMRALESKQRVSTGLRTTSVLDMYNPMQELTSMGGRTRSVVGDSYGITGAAGLYLKGIFGPDSIADVFHKQAGIIAQAGDAANAGLDNKDRNALRDKIFEQIKPKDGTPEEMREALLRAEELANKGLGNLRANLSRKTIMGDAATITAEDLQTSLQLEGGASGYFNEAFMQTIGAMTDEDDLLRRSLMHTSGQKRVLDSANILDTYASQSDSLEDMASEIEDLSGLNVDDATSRQALQILNRAKTSKEKIAILLQAVIRVGGRSDQNRARRALGQLLINVKRESGDAEAARVEKASVESTQGRSKTVLRNLVKLAETIGLDDGQSIKSSQDTSRKDQEILSKAMATLEQLDSKQAAILKTDAIKQLQGTFAGTALSAAVQGDMDSVEIGSALIGRARDMTAPELKRLSEKLSNNPELYSVIASYTGEGASKAVTAEDARKVTAAAFGKGDFEGISQNITGISEAVKGDTKALDLQLQQLDRVIAKFPMATAQFDASVKLFATVVSSAKDKERQEETRQVVEGALQPLREDPDEP